MKKSLAIITVQYPYGFSEQFFHIEVNYLSKFFDEIYLYPLYGDSNNSTIREMPSNVRVSEVLKKASRKISVWFYVKNLPFLFKIFASEFRYSNSSSYILKNWRNVFNNALQCKLLSSLFLSDTTSKGIDVFYSFWMNDGALILSILKQEEKINDFYFRVNGFDLFEERRQGEYMPFKHFNYKNTRKVFVLSNSGKEYLMEKNIYSDKVVLAYYGIEDRGINPFNDKQKFTIVSCSRLIPLKRVDKIIESLSYIDFDCNWIHFGDGPLRQELELLAKNKLKNNVNWKFSGNVQNSEIIEFYCQESINLFIHTSDTEGLGLAMIEAQSFGIPVMAVISGGVRDVVSENTGIELDINESSKSISEKIIEFKEGNKNTLLFREKVKKHCLEKFSAKRNYELLYKEMMS